MAEVAQATTILLITISNEWLSLVSPLPTSHDSRNDIGRRHSTADYVITNCDVGTDGENWAERCTELWAAVEKDKREHFANWQGQDTQICGACGKCGQVGRKMKLRDAPARMALLGHLIAKDSAKPIMLERDCVHQDGGPYRMLTMSLDAQLQLAMAQI